MSNFIPYALSSIKELPKFHKFETVTPGVKAPKSGTFIDGKYIKFAEGLQNESITYTGINLPGFYSTALLTGSTKSKIRMIPGIKFKANIGSLDIGDILQADGCAIEPLGQYTLDQKTLEVCDLAFKVPFCIKDWETTYLSEFMRPGSNVEENFPNGVYDYILTQLALKISEQTEALIFKGDIAGSPTTLCDGFQKKFLADAGIVDVAPTAADDIEDAATVIAELTKMYKAVPQTMLNQFDVNGNTKLKFFLNLNTIRAYRLALVATHPALIMENTGMFALNFMGIEIIPAPGLGQYKAVLADPMNLWYGTDLDSDLNDIQLVKDPTNPKTLYAIGSFKWGVQYGVSSEIVYYN